MTTEQIVGFIVVLLLMGIGLIGSIVPVLPGAGLVFVAAVAHRLYFGESGAATWVLILLGVMAAGSMLVDYLASAYGAKRLGATWRGLVGAVLGGMIGLFFSLPGILIGPFLGAFLFEWLGGRHPREAGRAGAGAVLGLLGGAVAKFACCFMMIALFATNVAYRSILATPPLAGPPSGAIPAVGTATNGTHPTLEQPEAR